MEPHVCDPRACCCAEKQISDNPRSFAPLPFPPSPGQKNNNAKSRRSILRSSSPTPRLLRPELETQSVQVMAPAPWPQVVDFLQAVGGRLKVKVQGLLNNDGESLTFPSCWQKVKS